MTQAFLQVEKSLTGRLWLSRTYDERESLALSQRFGLPDMIAKALSARGIGLEEAAVYLDPKIKTALPNPSLFKDMDAGVERFVAAVEKKQKIAIFGDYDVDGATSSALLLRFTRALGIEARLYVPDRLSEGYGPNPNAMRVLAKEGCKLVVCVDCGTTAHEALEAAKESRLDVVVIDHHAAAPSLPPACAVINPNRLDETMTDLYGTLAAVGVTYLFVVAVNRLLRERGFYTGAIKEPALLSWLDLVALGTVCDVVKLSGLNRAFVAQGLRVMGQRQNVGIVALSNVARLKGSFGTYEAGFVLGPRVNAGGRVGQSDLGAKLLSSNDPEGARLMAERLNGYNEERRELEARILVEAETLTFGEEASVTIAASENWHPGVIGIVASRLKEKFQRPALVIALEGDIGKGSGRSIGSIDLGALILAARQAGLLVAGGGHKMAAGFTVERSKLDAFKAFVTERVSKKLEAEPFIPALSIDGLVAAQALNQDFVEKLQKLAPFGTGNPEPRFALAECQVVHASVVGEKHVSLVLSQGGARLRAIVFRAMESDLGATLLALGTFHFAGHVRPDAWKGDGSAQLLVDDAFFVRK